MMQLCCRYVVDILYLSTHLWKRGVGPVLQRALQTIAGSVTTILGLGGVTELLILKIFLNIGQIFLSI